MSPLVADVFIALLAEIAAIEVVARFHERDAATGQLADIAPDLVLLGLERGEADDAGRRLLAQLPAATVIVLSPDGRDVFIHEMRPHRTPLLRISADDLVAALRTRLLAPKV